jgi:hypothetical protein
MFAGGKGGKDAFTSGVVGSVLHEAGVELHAQMKSAAGAKFAFAGSQLARGKEPMWPVKELPRQREVPPPLATHCHVFLAFAHHSFLTAQVLDHIEAQIFAAARGDYDRSHLLLAALLERKPISVLAATVRRPPVCPLPLTPTPAPTP